MKADPIIAKRFLDLEKKGEEVNATKERDDPYEGVDRKLFNEWSISVLNLLQRVFGEKSPQYTNFSDRYRIYNGYGLTFDECWGIFHGAKEDFNSGFLINIRSLIKAEDSVEILDQAEELLHANYKDPAGVLAGVALEIALKDLCNRNSVLVAKMDSMNTELCKLGVYNLGMQKQITAWAHLRNKAAHGEFSEYNNADVDLMIKGVTRFIGDYL